MVAFLESDAMAAAMPVLQAAPHFDTTRAPHEFKGFFLPEA